MSAGEQPHWVDYRALQPRYSHNRANKMASLQRPAIHVGPGQMHEYLPLSSGFGGGSGITIAARPLRAVHVPDASALRGVLDASLIIRAADRV
jgi:hypothetical protein